MEPTALVEMVKNNPLWIALFLLTLLVATALILLSRRISFLTRGESGASLEKTIRTLHERVETLETEAKRAALVLKNHDTRITRSMQGISVKRFDPFQGAGGQQSFATAFLNEKGDGAVISGIHARDGVRVYAKEVREFASERELSQEEADAIQKSRSNLKG